MTSVECAPHITRLVHAFSPEATHKEAGCEMDGRNILGAPRAYLSGVVVGRPYHSPHTYTYSQIQLYWDHWTQLTFVQGAVRNITSSPL